MSVIVKIATVLAYFFSFFRLPNPSEKLDCFRQKMWISLATFNEKNHFNINFMYKSVFIKYLYVEMSKIHW